MSEGRSAARKRIDGHKKVRNPTHRQTKLLKSGPDQGQLKNQPTTLATPGDVTVQSVIDGFGIDCVVTQRNLILVQDSLLGGTKCNGTHAHQTKRHPGV